MDTIKLSLQGAWELLYTGMFLGAGLPIMFALGVKLLAGQPISADGAEETVASPGVVPKILAGLCFALVAFAVFVGLLTIVAAGMGKEVSFENIYPTLVEKT